MYDLPRTFIFQTRGHVKRLAKQEARVLPFCLEKLAQGFSDKLGDFSSEVFLCDLPHSVILSMGIKVKLTKTITVSLTMAEVELIMDITVKLSIAFTVQLTMAITVQYTMSNQCIYFGVWLYWFNHHSVKLACLKQCS